MKLRMLDLLVCPCCGQDLSLEISATCQGKAHLDLESMGSRCANYCAFKGMPVMALGSKGSDCQTCYKTEVWEGLLTCAACGAAFPIVDSIPRMLPDAFADHPDFVRRYRAKLGKSIEDLPKEGLPPDLKKTKKSFGYEWLKEEYEITDEAENVLVFFVSTGIDPKVYELNYLEYRRRPASEIGYTPNGDFLRGKLVFDAGCGMGRYLEVVNRFDCEVVGLDLSAAVERAQSRTGDHLFTHIVQGDLLRAPFRNDTFDFIYSIGVLHHTPSTYGTFQKLVPLLRPGGVFSLSVYEKSHYPIKDCIEIALRKVTTRLPLGGLHYLSYIGVPLGWLQGKLRRHKLTRILGAPFFLFYVGGHRKWRIRLADTFDLYHPQYQWRQTKEEVIHWFEQEGFNDIRCFPHGTVCVTGVKAKVSCDSRPNVIPETA